MAEEVEEVERDEVEAEGEGRSAVRWRRGEGKRGERVGEGGVGKFWGCCGWSGWTGEEGVDVEDEVREASAELLPVLGFDGGLN